MCEKGIEDEKAGGKSEGICGQARLEGEERERSMQKLMLEECEPLHERLTPLCIPKPLQMKTASTEVCSSACTCQHVMSPAHLC